MRSRDEADADGTDLVALSDLDRWVECRLVRLQLHAALEERLMEQGFVPGAAITVARSGPSGDPRVYRVDGVEIALRRETAAGLWVRVENGSGGDR